MDKGTENITNPVNPQLTKSKSGKKQSKKLPEDFFEKVLDLELKLKREFTMGCLQELVNLYSMAIEYYESVEDPKYKDYQNRLNMLLSQPEILKKMNDHYLKKGQGTTQADGPSVNYAKKLKKEQEKKHIKMKVDYISHLTSFANNSNQIQKILETLEHENEEETTANNAVNDELMKQKDNFKARLEEKRRRQTMFSTNDMSEKLEVGRNKRFSAYLSGINGINLQHLKSDDVLKGEDENGERDENEGLTSARTKKTEQTERTEKTEKTDKSERTQKSGKTISEGDNVEIILESSFDKLDKGKYDEIDDMFSPFGNNEGTQNGGSVGINGLGLSSNQSNIQRDCTNLTNITTTMFKLNENMLDSKHIGPKQKQTFIEIKQTLDQFVNEFNFYFYEYVFQRFTEHIQKLMDEKYVKYIEISKNYHSQIKEMEFLITGDSEDQHREGIMAIIDSLKEEQESELIRLEDHYNKLIQDCQANFKSIGFKNNPGIQLIEEKLKLDLYNQLNLILLPKKNN